MQHDLKYMSQNTRQGSSKHPQATHSPARTKQKHANEKTVHGAGCECRGKLNSLQQQVSGLHKRINQLIDVIAAALQMSSDMKRQFIHTRDFQAEEIRSEQRVAHEESFLLQGIDVDTSPVCSKALLEEKIVRPMLNIGQVASGLEKRMAQIEQKLGDMARIKGNISMLTKIVQKLGDNYEGYQRFLTDSLEKSQEHITMSQIQAHEKYEEHRNPTQGKVTHKNGQPSFNNLPMSFQLCKQAKRAAMQATNVERPRISK